jgi:hypothetical protein
MKYFESKAFPWKIGKKRSGSNGQSPRHGFSAGMREIPGQKTGFSMEKHCQTGCGFLQLPIEIAETMETSTDESALCEKKYSYPLAVVMHQD